MLMILSLEHLMLHFRKDFAKSMQAEFEMSMMGELKYFLGIQINQTSEGTYVHETKYVKELLKKFNLSESKEAKTHVHPTCVLGKYEVSKKVNQKLYKGII